MSMQCEKKDVEKRSKEYWEKKNDGDEDGETG